MGSNPTVATTPICDILVRMTQSIKWGARTYTEEEFVKAWNESTSIASVARALDLTIYGSTYTTLKNTARILGLDNSHHTGKGWNTGKFCPKPRRPIESYLVENSTSSGSFLKSRIIKEGLLEEKCYAPECPNPTTTVNGFTGEVTKTPLTLDHINGINNDNRLENLRMLCPNCDRFTKTFCRGNKRTNKPMKPTIASIKRICECGGPKAARSARCRDCHHKFLLSAPRGFVKTKADWPDDNELVEMVRKSSLSAVGRSLGVSDNAVKKRLKLRGLYPL